MRWVHRAITLAGSRHVAGITEGTKRGHRTLRKLLQQGTPIMVEKKFSTVPNERLAEAEAKAEASTARADLDLQVAELRAEIARLTESVSAIGSGAKAVVTSEAEVLTERVRERIREEPVSSLLAVAALGFVFGLLARR